MVDGKSQISILSCPPSPHKISNNQKSESSASPRLADRFFHSESGLRAAGEAFYPCARVCLRVLKLSLIHI